MASTYTSKHLLMLSEQQANGLLAKSAPCKVTLYSSTPGFVPVAESVAKLSNFDVFTS